VGEVVATLVLSYNRAYGVAVVDGIALHHNGHHAVGKESILFANVLVAG
jgi:hypothetical protein